MYTILDHLVSSNQNKSITDDDDDDDDDDNDDGDDKLFLWHGQPTKDV